MKTLILLQFLGITTVFGHSFVKKTIVPFNNTQIIAKSSNNFGFAFLREIPKYQNAFISPISISMLMGLVYSGAKNNTAAEIQSVMEYPELVHQSFREILELVNSPDTSKTSRKDYDLEMANAMLIDSAFKVLKTYKEDSRKYYDSAVETISFSLHPQAAIKSVNEWVAWKTNKKIMKVLDEPLEPETKLFLMNAVYFKGTWKTKFDQRFTMPDTFYNDGLVPKTVPMMRQKGKLRYAFDINLQTHALELPYLGDDITMLILLPVKRNGLTEIEPQVSDSFLKQITSSLRETVVQVTLPRFSLVENYDLQPVFKRIGINSLFNPDSADLGGISPTEGLYVTKAVHKCAVEVNEEGSEAAAITGVSAGVRVGGPIGPLFNADHPFMFFIRDSRLDLTLFIGRVTKL